MRAFEQLSAWQQAAELRRIRDKAEAHVRANPPQGKACFLPKELKSKWLMAIY